jgi:hypothetical protein
VVVDSGADPTLNAVTALSEALVSSADELKLVDQELRTMRRRRQRGWSWRRIVSASGPANPLGVTMTIVATLGKSAGVLRRSLALALRHEGMKVTEIARLFGVSRQRVGALFHQRPNKLSDQGGIRRT